MRNVVTTDFADIDFSSYPIILLNIKGINPTENQIELFVDELLRVLKKFSGRYVVLANAEKAVWMSRESRELLATGLGFVETENVGRHCCNFIYVPSYMLWISVKLAVMFVKSEVKQNIYFDFKEAENEARDFVLKNL